MQSPFIFRWRNLNPLPLFVQVEDLVVVMDEGLRGHAAGIAQRLRRAGRRVDLVLESKKMKWVFKVSQVRLSLCDASPSGSSMECQWGDK